MPPPQHGHGATGIIVGMSGFVGTAGEWSPAVTRPFAIGMADIYSE